MDDPNATVRRPKGNPNDKSVAWYCHTFPGLEPAARRLLEEYSHIPPEEVDQYVIAMRDRAWEVEPYPCIGQYRFLNLSLSQKPSYPRILSRLAAGETYLEIGCCMGQGIRKLVHDGAPGENLHGVELEQPFIDLGCDLFRDRDTLRATLVQADAFDLGGDSPLGRLVGRVDIIHAGMVLHLFGWDKQRQFLDNCVRLLRPAPPAAMILGQAIGDVDGHVESITGTRLHHINLGMSKPNGQKVHYAMRLLRIHVSTTTMRNGALAIRS